VVGIYIWTYMKTFLSLLVSILLVQSASAQVYSMHVVGYVNRTFGVGATLFNNPLAANANNNLSSLFGPGTPEGTSISLWNTTTAKFDITALYSGGLWSQDLTLNPGTGCLVTTPTEFLNTFSGYVENHDGTLYSFGDNTIPSFSGSSGLYLLGDKEPIEDVGSDIFLNLIGRLPNVGEQVVTFSYTSTYLGDNNWDILPTLGVSDAVFLNLGTTPSTLLLPEAAASGSVTGFPLGTVPEPGTIALTVLGVALLPFWRRRAV